MSNSSRLVVRALGRLAPILAGIAIIPHAASAQAPREAGVWVDDSGSGAIEIYVCSDRADRLCGRIVWLKEPLNAQGVAKRDKYNPSASMQTRPICGLPVLGNLEKVSEGGFDNGWIYDPKVGKSYSAAIQLASPDRLTVTGYVGVKFLGKTFSWTRAPADLVKCNSTASANQIKAAKAAQPAAQKPPTAAAPAASASKAAAADTPVKEAAAPSAPASKPAVAAPPASPASPQQANAEPASVPTVPYAAPAALASPANAGTAEEAPAAAPAKAEAKAAPAPKSPAEKAAAAKPATVKAGALPAPPKASVAAKAPVAKTATAQAKALPGTEQKSGVGGPSSRLMPWELYGIGDDNGVTR